MDKAAVVPVSEVMRTEFASLREGDRLDLADQVMKLGRVRHLPVLADDGRLVGIVSNRDLLEASLTSVLSFEPEQRRGFLRSIEVKEVMKHTVETVSPDTTLGVAASCMIRQKIGCLPVVDPNHRMLGLVTETDLLIAAYLPEAPAEPSESEPAGSPSPSRSRARSGSRSSSRK